MTCRRSAPLALAPLVATVLLLSACASGPPPQAVTEDATVSAQWHAPLPHEGRVGELGRWWQQFEDPLLDSLMAAAQAASPTLASARSRIEQARANRVSAGAALGPTLDATASASRGRQELSMPIANTATAGLAAGWELDLFGGGRAALAAASARFEGAQADWHAARVAVAAEVANAYLGLRACEAQRVKTEADARSRAETARLTDLAADAGMEAPANAALARASAAQGESVHLALKAQCDNTVKSLVALTALDETDLRRRLAERSGTLPAPAGLTVAAVPAEVLNQRPDLYTAARDVSAASADLTQARAARWPRVSLAGSIGRVRVETSAATAEGTTWAVGPVAITLPLFDGGARRANVDAARARYDEAVALYRARVRDAVREVEQALVLLESTSARRENARIAAEGFDTSFRAVEARYRGGLASLFELEDARRSALQSQVNLIDLERDRVSAWVSLYRALGGGWSSDAPPPTEPDRAAAEARTNATPR
ncbi:efflux transporter outer membrane subunit [Rhizobacter sp. LjRoot28]|uniref:efflux transporter outer membrane subunit n=1 Tax=Rhizobacter sp. LjRoot28 TaxID=3342309 RepID=UPI003ECE773A